jgi:hypothetical protein
MYEDGYCKDAQMPRLLTPLPLLFLGRTGRFQQSNFRCVPERVTHLAPSGCASAAQKIPETFELLTE